MYLFAVATAAPGAPAVILDTDIGDDIDDTWALAYLLGSPQLDLQLVVTASDNTPLKTRLLAKIMDKIGRTNIPIGTGVKNSDHPINQSKWLGDYDLKMYPGKVHEDGVAAMIDIIMKSERPVTLIVIGPQTNIKEALRREPGIAGKARVVSMAGSVEIGYGGKAGRQPEWNIVKDVEAARAVFAAPWDITFAPLDTCGTLVLKGERFARVRDSKNPLAQVVIDNYRAWANFDKHPEGESSVLFDTEAVYLAMDNAFCEMKTVKLSIDDKGNTVPDENGRPVNCAMGWKNKDGFEELLVKALE
jgi:inosine-uridine nucleoside N-ribohydrolase